MAIIGIPRIGERKKLMLPSPGILQRPKIIEGFYIGYNQLKTSRWVRPTQLEGYGFLVLGENGKQEIYCQRRSELDLTYWDDCDNCPYQMGIEVEEIEGFELSPLELEFIKSKIDERNK